MKWYIAARTRYKKEVDFYYNILREFGQEISYDWTKEDQLYPFDINFSKSKEIAKSISNAIKDTDIFVLLSHKEGTDMYVELGLAISRFEEAGKLKIYAVGEYNKKSLMHLHPKIIHVDKLRDVFSKEEINTQNP